VIILFFRSIAPIRSIGLAHLCYFLNPPVEFYILHSTFQRFFSSESLSPSITKKVAHKNFMGKGRKSLGLVAEHLVYVQLYKLPHKKIYITEVLFGPKVVFKKAYLWN
jgi:hypothetical protein